MLDTWLSVNGVRHTICTPAAFLGWIARKIKYRHLKNNKYRQLLRFKYYVTIINNHVFDPILINLFIF